MVKASASPPKCSINEGRARMLFDGEETAMTAILGGAIRPGDIVVIATRPRGAPGDARDLGPTAAIAGMGLDRTVALLTDRLQRQDPRAPSAIAPGQRQAAPSP